MNWFIIFIFIVSIALFLITKYYRLKKELAIEKIEEFENEAALTTKDKLFNNYGINIKYLDSNEASNLIIKDGDYFQGMNQANLIARNCNNLDELYTKYKTAFDDITNDEKDNVDNFVLELILDIENNNNIEYRNYVIKWIKTISIAKAQKWLESGMPHTLETTIVMDANWFLSPRKTTFIHEITHVHQRQHPMDFEDLYPLLGYVFNPVDIKGLENIYPLNRNNPDGMSKYWLWYSDSKFNTDSKRDNNFENNNLYWWIGAIFTSAIPNSLTDVNLLALKLDKDKDGTFYYLKQNPTQLSKFKEFNMFFGNNPNNYHPNEMTAKFSEWYLLEILKSNKGNDISNNIYEYGNYNGYLIYKKYFEKMCKLYYT